MVLILIFGEVLGLYGYDDDSDGLTIAQQAVCANRVFQAHCRIDIEHEEQ